MELPGVNSAAFPGQSLLWVPNAIIAVVIGLGREAIHLLHGSTGRADSL